MCIVYIYIIGKSLSVLIVGCVLYVVMCDCVMFDCVLCDVCGFF